MNRRNFITTLAIIPATAQAFLVRDKPRLKIDIYHWEGDLMKHTRVDSNNNPGDEAYHLSRQMGVYKELKPGDFVRMESDTHISSYIIVKCNEAIQCEHYHYVDYHIKKK
jgi:hypothetical protein